MPSAKTAGNVGSEPAAGARARAGRAPSGRRGHISEPRGRLEASGRLGLARVLTPAVLVVPDFSIVNVALASIERELGFSPSAAGWIVTGYAIAFGGLLILGGRAADIFGRRRMFISGLLVFTGASLAGGLAHDPVLLVAS